MPLLTKIEATLHLTGYAVHLLLFALVVLYPFVIVLSLQYPALISLFGIALIFNATAMAPTTFFIVAQRELNRRWWQKLPAIFFLTALGSGMMVNTVRAAVGAFFGSESVFKRTPKFGIIEKGQKWVGHRYQLQLDPIVYFEFLLALINLGTIILALGAGNWIIAFYAAIFCVGLLFTSGMTLLQAITIARRAHRQTGQKIKNIPPIQKAGSPLQE